MDDERAQESDEAELTGLAHVGTVSFLAARIAPSLQFWLALAGGVAVARASARRGLSAGLGTSLASMLQTIAILGPLRINGPLTTALSAPPLGWLWAKGRSFGVMLLACLAVRTVHYAILSVLLVLLVYGGIDEFTDFYENIIDFIDGFVDMSWLPTSEAFIVGANVVFWMFLAVFFSSVQVVVYRRALPNWPPPGAGKTHADEAPPEEHEHGMAALAAHSDEEHDPAFDPRALAVAAVVGFAILLASTAWLSLAAVAAWLAAAFVITRPEREVVRIGVYLTLFFAAFTVIAGLIASLGLDEALRRGLRAGLLVLVATWLRGAAGPTGMRELFHRGLSRLARFAWIDHGRRSLEQMDSGPRLAAAGRTLMRDLEDVELKPWPMADALTQWVSDESSAFRGLPPTRAVRFVLRGRDGAIVALAALPALTLVGLA